MGEASDWKNNEIRKWFLAATLVGLFVAGVVALLAMLARKVTELSKIQDELIARVDELRADIDAANTELLILRAEADLRQEQVRRLMDEERDDDWPGLN